VELARGRESEPARIIDLRCKDKIATRGISLWVAILFMHSQKFASIAAAQCALEAVDGELAGHDALKI